MIQIQPEIPPASVVKDVDGDDTSSTGNTSRNVRDKFLKIAKDVDDDDANPKHRPTKSTNRRHEQ